jgi:hypothetical protein
VLAIHLLHEVSKKEASIWYPYVCQLPRGYSTLPHFTPEEAAALQARPQALSVTRRASS